MFCFAEHPRTFKGLKMAKNITRSVTSELSPSIHSAAPVAAVKTDSGNRLMFERLIPAEVCDAVVVVTLTRSTAKHKQARHYRVALPHNDASNTAEINVYNVYHQYCTNRLLRS